MITKRRHFLAMGAASPFFAMSRAAFSQDDAQNPGIFDDFRTPENDPQFGTAPVRNEIGIGAPKKEEIEVSLRLLFGVPDQWRARNGARSEHMEIAAYYQGISETNADGEKYNAEWSKPDSKGTVRANPLITGFFSSTHTAPSVIRANGDQLSWCASFVNHVLILSGRPGTWSAMSGSFRNGPYPQTTEPKLGDLVVFRNAGPSGDKGHGHVAFFVSMEGDNVTVLGGNQRGNTGTSGAVCTITRPLDVGTQYLHSFRRVV